MAITVLNIVCGLTPDVVTAYVALESSGSTGTVDAFIPGFDQNELDEFVNSVKALTSIPASRLFYDGTTIDAYPSQPSAAHIWEWSTYTWSFDLSEGKALKWEEVKAVRYAQEFGEFEWDGHTFDGTALSQSRLCFRVLRAQAALAASETWSTEWTLADNSDIELSASDVVEVAEALDANIASAHATARAKRALIDAATSFEDLEAI